MPAKNENAIIQQASRQRAEEILARRAAARFQLTAGATVATPLSSPQARKP
jgi:hypothetical protein